MTANHLLVVLLGATWVGVAVYMLDVRRRFLALDAWMALLAARTEAERISADATKVAGEAEAREHGLAQAHAQLQAAQFAPLWEALKLDELRCKGIGPDTLERLRAAGLATIAALARANVEAVPGIGPTRGMLIRQRLDYLRRRVNDQVEGLPQDGLPGPADRSCVRAVADVIVAHPLWTNEGFSLRGRIEPARDTLATATRAFGFWRWLFDRRGCEGGMAVAVAEHDVVLRECRASSDTLLRDIDERRCPDDRISIARFYEERKAEVVDVLGERFRREKLFGGMAETVARLIEATPCQPVLRGVTLRPYQVFGVKFMIAQRRVVLGDEMGLGKTLQSIAFATHVRRERQSVRGLVVAPVTLLDNWFREIERFSLLRAWIVRGAEKATAWRAFQAEGGIALVSYEAARDYVLRNLIPEDTFDLLVVDEAHYAKNPRAGRSLAVQELAARASHVVLLTGTPIENRLSDMVNLIGIAQVALADELRVRGADENEAMTPGEFTERVSSAYLRRTQNDVLRELPERIENNEWLHLENADRAAYSDAVRRRSYVDMRRAVTLGQGTGQSTKLGRLSELCEAYRESGRKMIVFSFFLDVLAAVQARLPTPYVITGHVPPAERQPLIDRFSAEDGHALLIAQVNTAGVGLNIQAASVVVFMEPQFKPSTEWQAIARAHRMGQKQRVMVHRLLAVDSVDTRIYELLVTKAARVAAYAHESRLKAVSREATRTEDPTEPEENFARRVIAEEYTRIFDAQLHRDSV